MKTFLLASFAAALACSLAACSSTINGGGGTCDDDDPPPINECGPVLECVEGEWVETGSLRCSEPPEPFCPDTLPAHGSDCFGEISCEYPGTDEECGDPDQPIYATCLDGTWVVSYEKCSPPPPECPESVPEAGADCSEYSLYGDLTCSYAINCGDGSYDVVCQGSPEGFVWVHPNEPGCGAPCHELGVEGCAADPSCQWLVPGCDDENPIAEGCYPTTDCQTTDGCGDGGACVLYTYDPCAGQACDACAAQFGVCEALLGD